MKIFKKINVKIKQKLLINPIMTILFLGILFIIVFLGLSKQRNIIKDIYEVRFINFSDSAEMTENILDIHSNLNQLLILASNEKEKHKINENSTNISKGIDALLDKINSKLKNDCTKNEKETCELLTNQLNDYKEWVNTITINLTKDSNNVNMFMLIANEKLKEIQKSLKIIKEEELKLSKVSYDSSKKSYFIIQISIFISLVILITISVILSFILIKSILKPLNNLKNILEDVASGEGDLTRKIDIKRNDEIGELGDLFNAFINKIKNIVIHIKDTSVNGKNISKMLAEISSNVSTKISEISSTIESDKNNINQLNNNLQSSVSAVSQISGSIKSISESIHVQLDSVNKTAVSTEEFAVIIKNLSNVIDEKKSLSLNLSSLAKTGLEKMNESTEAINKIAQSSNDMLDMMKIIDDITRETNLLSMNAAIEAAHAGESGKGFSVVSDEIRKLSEETAINSKSINNTLKQISSDIKNFDELYKTTQQSLYSIIDGIQNVVNAMEEMYSNINELVIGSNEIVKETNELANTSKDIRKDVAEINTSSTSIDDNMKNISQLSNVILNEIDNIHNMSMNISASITELTNIGESNKKSILEIDENLNQFKT